MTAAVRFTKASIATLICPTGKSEAFFWDASLTGFGIRAYASGKRLWLAQYRDGSGRTRRATLGDLRAVMLDEAREAARKMLSQAALGADPAAAKQAARRAVRVAALVQDYLTDAKTRLKPRSYDEVERHLNKHAKPLHQNPVGDVDRGTIVRMLKKLGEASGPVAANRTRASLSAMWTWGLKSGLIEGDNPVANVPVQGVEAPRERVLSDDELALIWAATDDVHDHSRIVRLLMLTGARREEVGALAWGEIEGEMWTLPSARAKNHLPHEVPLAPLALEQLPAKRTGRDLVFGDGAGGFSGWSRCKERLDERIMALMVKAFTKREGRAPNPDEVKLVPWVLHDLRRTLSTWMNENGVEPHIVEAVLNHASGAAKRGVAGVYNRAAYRVQKRGALALWEKHVREVAGLPTVVDENVIVLKVA